MATRNSSKHRGAVDQGGPGELHSAAFWARPSDLSPERTEVHAHSGH